MKKDTTDYIKMLLLWLGPMALIVVGSFTSEKVYGPIYAFLGIYHLYVAVNLVPLFRSWKTLALWEKLTNGIEMYIADEVLLKQAAHSIKNVTKDTESVKEYYSWLADKNLPISRAWSSSVSPERESFCSSRACSISDLSITTISRTLVKSDVMVSAIASPIQDVCSSLRRSSNSLTATRNRSTLYTKTEE